MTLYLVFSSIALGMGILGALAKGIRALYLWCRTMGDLLAATSTRAEQLDPNGGGSVRDRVEAIHAVVTRLESMVEGHGDDIRALQKHRWF